MDKEINNNGFDYIDLELPSGTLWATCNVGANKPSDYGLYFQWGDTSGYTKDQVGYSEGKKKFSWTDCKWRLSGDSWNNIAFTKYKTKGAKLELKDDAANANIGGDWHIPTPTQIQELIDYTESTWTTQDDVYGRLFTSKKDASKSIFIPAAGYAWNGSVKLVGSEADVWASTLNTDSVDSGQFLGFYSGSVYLSYGRRYGGFSVRGVIG